MKRLIIPAFLLAVLAAAPQPGRAGDDDEGVMVETYPKLRMYGFADMTYRLPLIDDSNYFWNTYAHSGSATIGNLNLYLDSQVAKNVRSLVEVRFTYAPNGSLNTADGKGGQVKGSTLVTDYGGANNSNFTWGGIDIERAWIEYKHRDWLTVRAGEFLTPYGVWNVDHGSPTLIGYKPPLIIQFEWFPRHQMGAEIYGSHYFGNLRAGYHLTISNGRIGNNPETVHTNSTPGLGGRLFLEGSNFGEWRVGTSGYMGRYTLKQTSTPLNGTQTTQITSEYDEHVIGADLEWKYRRFRLVSEALYSGVDPSDRFPNSRSYHRYGAYVLVSGELPWGFVPWVNYDVARTNSDNETTLNTVKVGINKHIVPGLVVKVAVSRLWYENHATIKDRYDEFVTQAAWAF